MSGVDSIRLVPELRAVHLTRYLETTPAQMLYFTENYDLRDSVVPREIRRVTFVTALRILWRSQATVLEMPEPLWVRFLPRNILLSLAWKTGGLVARHKRLLVTYAMENNTIDRLIGGGRLVPPVITGAFSWSLGLYIRVLVDRIAFATEGSRDLYRSLPFVGAIETCLIEELPSAAELSNARDHPEVPPTGVRGPNAIFVGVLEPRKGIGELMRAWESVEIGLPDAVLRIIGPGPLHRSVADWTRLRPDQRIYEGQQSRDSVLAAIGSATVLVAPSMPSGRWREQVGLPIKEALAAGLTVVTTDQTGLAFWLKSHGHRVVPAELVARDLAPELIAALCTPLDAVVVRATLPAVDGRYRSDSWLHRH